MCIQLCILIKFSCQNMVKNKRRIFRLQIIVKLLWSFNLLWHINFEINLYKNTCNFIKQRCSIFGIKYICWNHSLKRIFVCFVIRWWRLRMCLFPCRDWSKMALYWGRQQTTFSANFNLHSSKPVNICWISKLICSINSTEM